MREALKLALEHIEGNYTVSDEDAITAIKEALAQPERTWVGLTDEEREDIVLNSTSKNKAVAKTEAKLKEKNT